MTVCLPLHYCVPTPVLCPPPPLCLCRAASASGSRQESLVSLKSHAVATYKALQELLGLEQTFRAESVDKLNEVSRQGGEGGREFISGEAKGG